MFCFLNTSSKADNLGCRLIAIKKKIPHGTQMETNNLFFWANFVMTLTNEQKDLPIMHWLPKRHKTPVGCHFIVASKQCIT